MQNGKQRGFAYLSVMIMVAVMSIMAFQLSGTLSVRMNRGKEADLLFNGNQIASAVKSYFESGPVRGCYPPNFEALLEDRRDFQTHRHLRMAYKDPMSAPDSVDGGWGILRDHSENITGVFSKSTDRPYKQGDFPKHQKDFEGRSQYSEWQFLAKGSKVKPASAAVCNQ